MSRRWARSWPAHAYAALGATEAVGAITTSFDGTTVMLDFFDDVLRGTGA